jgi:hypothetical protein
MDQKGKGLENIPFKKQERTLTPVKEIQRYEAKN